MERIDYDTIWSELRSRHGAEFSREVIDRNTSSSGFTVLSECTKCGLRFFIPVMGGDPDFYDGLATPQLEFAENRWEFAEVRRIVSKADAVVDFGSGAGAFLRSLPGSQHRRVGIDHSTAAVRRMEAAGIEGYACDFAEFADQERGMFDVACAFHVVEHLPRVGLLVEAAITCLRPGGRLVVSVPNRDRIVTGEFPVLDCPPHHVSRWQPEQFIELANRFDLGLIATRFERRPMPPLQQLGRLGAPVVRQAAKHLVARAARRLHPPRTEKVVGPKARGSSRPNFIRRMGWGHSMLAEFATREKAC